VKQVEVAVIGTGWCGGIRSETLSRSALVDKLHVCEIRPDRLKEVQALTRAAHATLDYQDIVKDPAISVVDTCTTPEPTHFPIARDCLKAGKHVLVEKPLASTSDQAQILIDEAARQKLVLMVDHTFVYTDAVRKMRELIASGALGEIYYYDAVRVNLGLFQHDVGKTVGPLFLAILQAYAVTRFWKASKASDSFLD